VHAPTLVSPTDAVAGQSDSHVATFVEHRGLHVAVKLLSDVVIKGTALSRKQRWPGIGNLMKLLITVLGSGTNQGVQETCFALKYPDVVVEVMKEAPDESVVRKNASVVIAKLAKYPKVCGVRFASRVKSRHVW
jgi:hypothetical protein